MLHVTVWWLFCNWNRSSLIITCISRKIIASWAIISSYLFTNYSTRYRSLNFMIKIIWPLIKYRILQWHHTSLVSQLLLLLRLLLANRKVKQLLSQLAPLFVAKSWENVLLPSRRVTVISGVMAIRKRVERFIFYYFSFFIIIWGWSICHHLLILVILLLSNVIISSYSFFCQRSSIC